jgi:hypothetical protein
MQILHRPIPVTSAEKSLRGQTTENATWPADLKRHLKSKHGQQKSTLRQQQPYTLTPEQQQQQQQQQLYTFTPEQQPPAAAAAAPEQQPYSQSNEEEPYYILKTNNPYTFYVPDGYYPDHFMPWVHPTRIAGLGHPRPQRKTFNHPRRSHGRILRSYRKTTLFKGLRELYEQTLYELDLQHH